MNEETERLMAWQPGAARFSRDDVIGAIGLQCRKKRFPVKGVLEWLGPPDKCLGNAVAGHLVYFYSYDFWDAPMFDVVDSTVIHFGVVNIHEPNAKRVDPDTDTEVLFNILYDMTPFNEEEFMKEDTQPDN